MQLTDPKTFRPSRRGPGPEQSVQVGILAYLKACGIHADRRNVGAVKQGKRFVRFSRPGQSDISGTIPGSGRRLEIECKAGYRELTAEQAAWLSLMQQLGAVAFVARSIDDVRRELGNWLTTTEWNRTCGRVIG